MSDLKPCPFCGVQPKLPDGDGTQYEIWCEDCGGAVASVQICDLMTLEERASDSFKDYRYGEEFVERAKLEAIDKWNTRAAPAEDVQCSEVNSQCSEQLRIQAEDVRAVGDEPVAFELLFNGEQVDVVGKRGFPPASLETYHRNGYESGRLYRHPQRPVVMPVRKPPEHWMAYGWNACLDEISRLNP